MWPMPKSPLRPGLALGVVVAGHMFAGIFMRNLGAGLDEIADPFAAKIARSFHWLFVHTAVTVAPLLIGLVIFLIYRLWRGKPVQWGIDILGGLLTIRCLVLFVLLNLLLLSQLRAGGLLLMQLILFLPVITLNFGWLYWRLDTGARIKGGKDIRFAEDDDTPSPFDYFHIATRTLLQFEPSGASAVSKTMKTLFVIHGIMMLDLVALTLSRAIALASGG
jgi:hypothetical protein